MAEPPLLAITDLSVAYRRRGTLHADFQALSGINLTLTAGQAHAIVGESGAGKTTLARCVAGLHTPTSGHITFRGAPLNPRHDPAQRRAIQMIFQDPYGSLNPRITIGAALTELLRVNKLTPTRAAATQRATQLLALVGLPPETMRRRPAAFSGGQRQRIGIARALALQPQLLIADEPVSALDVSIQASILLLLKRLQHQLGLTLLLITHDLAVVHQLCDHVTVLNQGHLIEHGTTQTIFTNPKHDYTKQLLAAATELPPLETPPPPGRKLEGIDAQLH